MELYEAIQKRSSVRAYTDRPVEEDKLQRVLQAVRLAPSARNTQEWKFIVVRDAELRAQLAAASEQKFLAEAPIVVAGVTTEPDREMMCKVPAGPVNLAIAMEHLALAAAAEGLGTCWVGHFPQDACCNLLDVPPTAKIVELMSLGYPAEALSGTSQPRKALDEIVCYERFK
jgi:nitroreductase